MAQWMAPERISFDDAQRFLVAAVAQLPDAGSDPMLIVNLSPLRHFDSSAIAALAALRRRATERGVDVVCVNPPDKFVRLAALYDVDQLLLRTTP